MTKVPRIETFLKGIMESCGKVLLHFAIESMSRLDMKCRSLYEINAFSIRRGKNINVREL